MLSGEPDPKTLVALNSLAVGGMQTFFDSLPLAKAKMLNHTIQTMADVP